jgi:inorganic pyrophosphatase
MSFENLSAGDDLPSSFNAVIEIPANGGEIKYEVDKDTGLLMVDRFMPTAMYYPCNYGYVPKTLAQDGDPADVLVITPSPVLPGCAMKVRAIGVLKMSDEAGQDSKILAVPVVKACMRSAQIKELADIPAIFLEKIKHFFEQYKALEPNKWVKVEGWGDRSDAEKELMDSVSRYAEQG